MLNDIRFGGTLEASMQSSIKKLAYEQLYDKNPFIQQEKDEWYSFFRNQLDTLIIYNFKHIRT